MFRRLKSLWNKCADRLSAIGETPNTFLYQFSVINFFGIFLLFAAFFQGWIIQIYYADTVHITSIIAATFLLGLIISFAKAFGLNKLWNRLHDGDESLLSRLKGKTIDGLGLKLTSKIQIVHHIAVVLPLLGLVGTMIGIILALKSTEAFALGDQANMALAILLFFKGVYVKFYASLVGILGHTWLITNYHMLTTKSRLILARMVEHV